MQIINFVNQYTPKQTKPWAKRPVSNIRYLTVHYTAATGNRNYQDLANMVARVHINQNGWPGIGYHYLIAKDGTIAQTNHIQDITYHDKNNTNSVGICLDGYFHPPHNEQVPKKQLDSLYWLLTKLMNELKIPKENIRPHREAPKNNTSCCGDILVKQLKQWLNNENETIYMTEEQTNQILQFIDNSEGIAEKEPLKELIKQDNYYEAFDRLISGNNAKKEMLDTQGSKIDETNQHLIERRKIIESQEKEIERLQKIYSECLDKKKLLTDTIEKLEKDNKEKKSLADLAFSDAKYNRAKLKKQGIKLLLLLLLLIGTIIIMLSALILSKFTF